MSHSALPSTTPRLSEAILRRAAASTASPCSANCSRTSRPARKACAKLEISTSFSSRKRARDSRARNRILSWLSFTFHFFSRYRSSPSHHFRCRGRSFNIWRILRLQHEAFFFGEAFLDAVAQAGRINAWILAGEGFGLPIGFVLEAGCFLEIC